MCPKQGLDIVCTDFGITLLQTPDPVWHCMFATQSGGSVCCAVPYGTVKSLGINHRLPGTSQSRTKLPEKQKCSLGGIGWGG